MSETLQIPKYLEGHVQSNKSIERLALRLFRKGGSNRTVQTYVEEIIIFCRWLGLGPDLAIKTRYDWPAKINEYLDHLIAKQGLARATATRKAASIKKWFVVNEIDSDWGRIELPKTVRTETDQIPTRDEMKSIVSNANLSERVLVLMAVSSGLRLSTLSSLRIKYLDLNREIPSIRLPRELTKNRRSHLTFMSPEAREVLKAYIEDRKLRGETITPESPVIATDRPLGGKLGRQGVWIRWMNVLARSGLARKEEGKKWHLLHFHTLRKYFKTWSSLSGVNSEIVEFFMGHRASIAQTYFIGGSDNIPAEIIARLEVEYRKALPALTIMSEGEKVKELEESIEELRDEADKRKREAEEKEQALREKVSLIEKLEYRLAKLERKLDRELEKQTLTTSSQ